ncbi:MAG: hypothetical protein R6X14_05440 [bacterium]
MNRRTAGVMLLLATISIGHGALKAYEALPVKQQWSGWTDSLSPNNHVGQVVTVNFDSLAYCEFFTGEGDANRYFVEVLTYPGGALVADGDTVEGRSHGWVRLDLNTVRPESIIRGRQLEFRFRRSGQAALNYYWAEGVYPYGHIVDPFAPESRDLALRVAGVARTENNLFGSHLFQLPMWADWGQGGSLGWDRMDGGKGQRENA